MMTDESLCVCVKSLGTAEKNGGRSGACHGLLDEDLYIFFGVSSIFLKEPVDSIERSTIFLERLSIFLERSTIFL